MTNGMVETEMKLIFNGGLSFGIAEIVDGLGDCTIDAREQAATYFDTETLALTRAGASLRFRSDDGWTVKLPRHHADRALVRDELTIAGDEGEPPRRAADLVLAFTRSDALVPIARVHTSRQRAVVEDSEGAVIEIVVDDVEGCVVSTGQSMRFLEAEVESKRADVADVVDKVVARLEALGGDSRTPLPKVARVLGSAASAPADVVEPRRVRNEASREDMVRAAIATGTRRLIECDAAVRIDADTEGVHLARTTARRLRSDLRTFRGWLDYEWCETLRSELRWLGTELGRVRDADVMLDSLAVKATTLPSDERANADVLRARLATMRQRDFEALLEAMRSDRYIALLDQLVDAANAPRLRPGMRADHARRATRHVARRQARSMRKAARRLPSNPSNTDLHELRKRAKKTRYAFEAIAPTLGHKAARAAAALADVQDALGLHQDAVVAIAWLSGAALDSDTQALAFTAGRLAARYELDMVAARSAWRSQWTRARRRLKHFE